MLSKNVVISTGLLLMIFGIYYFVVKTDDNFSGWSESKTALGSIHTALHEYSVKNNGDLSAFNAYGKQNEIFVNDVLLQIGMHEDALKELQYFDWECFRVYFIKDGKIAQTQPLLKHNGYVITVDATRNSQGGMGGNGPEKGYISYDSSIGTWSDSFQSD